MTTPTYEHDCGELLTAPDGTITTEWGCKFIGQITANRGDDKFVLYDVWVHYYDGYREGNPSIVLRYSDEGPEYASLDLHSAIQFGHKESDPSYCWTMAVELVREKEGL
jgi:hypothetical protein